MDNSELRKELKLKRNSLSKEEILTLSDKITDNVLSLDLTAYKNVFIYKSFNSEVDTNRLISHFLKENKVVAYPVITGETMVAGTPKTSDITKSKFGTDEPSCYAVMDKVDVCFIPLLACDKNKNRLGYGKGYYDKFLAKNNCLKIGLCYNFQVVEEIENKPWDIPLDIIVTESQII